MANFLFWGFSKEIYSIKSIIIMNFYRLLFILNFSLYEVFHWYFSVSWSLSSLLVIIIIIIVTFVTIYNFLFYKCGRSTDSKNLQMKLWMRLPKFQPQYFLKQSVLYIPVHILGHYKCNLVVRSPISDLRFFLEKVCHSNATKWRMRPFLLRIYFYFYDELTPSNHSHKKRKDSLETWAACSWILILTWNFGGGRGDSASTFSK